MKFPVCIDDAGTLRIILEPTSFVYGEGDDAIQHPASVWDAWTAEDWVIHCPTYTFLTIIDTPPAQDDTKIITKLSTDQWEVRGNTIQVKYVAVDKTQEQINSDNDTLIKQVADAVQAFMDKSVRVRNYDNILSACTYATSSIPKYQAEGQSCVEWRDAVWVKCFQLMDEVATGTRPKMTPSEVVNELPQLIWPTV